MLKNIVFYMSSGRLLTDMPLEVVIATLQHLDYRSLLRLYSLNNRKIMAAVETVVNDTLRTLVERGIILESLDTSMFDRKEVVLADGRTYQEVSVPDKLQDEYHKRVGALVDLDPLLVLEMVSHLNGDRSISIAGIVFDGKSHWTKGNNSVLLRQNEYDDEIWLQNRKLHRANGPALLRRHSRTGDDVEAWYLHGQVHRMGGPAITIKNGRKVTKIWVEYGLITHAEPPMPPYFRKDANPFTSFLIRCNKGPLDVLVTVTGTIDPSSEPSAIDMLESAVTGGYELPSGTMPLAELLGLIEPLGIKNVKGRASVAWALLDQHTRDTLHLRYMPDRLTSI